MGWCIWGLRGGLVGLECGVCGTVGGNYSKKYAREVEVSS